MLKGLLDRNECEKCQICCGFDSTDIWEAPNITDETQKNILQNYNSSQEFFTHNGCRTLKMPKEPDEDLYFCTMLDRSKGCKMGDEKPFDCKIWPFRVMNLNNSPVLTLSPVCPAVWQKPMSSIFDKANEISNKAFEYARQNPNAIKPYIKGYPIIITEH